MRPQWKHHPAVLVRLAEGGAFWPCASAWRSGSAIRPCACTQSGRAAWLRVRLQWKHHPAVLVRLEEAVRLRLAQWKCCLAVLVHPEWKRPSVVRVLLAERWRHPAVHACLELRRGHPTIEVQSSEKLNFLSKG